MLTRARDDFLTDEQRMIRDTARDFARAELAPHAGAWEDQGWIPDGVVATMGELGLLRMTVPPEWGGTGADYVSYVLAVEEVAAGCAATATHESTGQYVDDTALTAKVKTAIFDQPTLKSAEINVETFKGVVQLSGFVSSKDNIDTAVSTAKGVKGVTMVKNDMRLK